MLLAYTESSKLIECCVLRGVHKSLYPGMMRPLLMSDLAFNMQEMRKLQCACALKIASVYMVPTILSTLTNQYIASVRARLRLRGGCGNMAMASEHVWNHTVDRSGSSDPITTSGQSCATAYKNMVVCMWLVLATMISCIQDTLISPKSDRRWSNRSGVETSERSRV
jgi:hypothetical protein